MRYLSTKTFIETEIDLATADLPSLLDAYNSLFEQSDSGGAFPGSKAWRKAEVYAKQLEALVAARPEIEEYRTNLINERARERAAQINPWTN